MAGDVLLGDAVPAEVLDHHPGAAVDVLEPDVDLGLTVRREATRRAS